MIGLMAGVIGTGFGGMAVALLKQPNRRMFGVVLGFSAGIMLAVVSFDLMPEAFEIGGTLWAVAGLVGGAMLMAVIDLVLPHIHSFSTDKESSKFVRAGVLVGLGISMHNLPEGLAIGASYSSSSEFGFGIAVLMAIQNFPEGMAMGAPMLLGGLGPLMVAVYVSLAGVPMGVGALLGQVLGTISPIVLSVSLGFAAGAMLFITCDELIPAAHELQEGHSSIYGIVFGVIVGIVVSRFISTL